jgi:hypothetical protein
MRANSRSASQQRNRGGASEGRSTRSEQGTRLKRRPPTPSNHVPHLRPQAAATSHLRARALPRKRPGIGNLLLPGLEPPQHSPASCYRGGPVRELVSRRSDVGWQAPPLRKLLLRQAFPDGSPMLELDFARMTTLSLVCAHLQTTPNALQSYLSEVDAHYTPLVIRRRGKRLRTVFKVSHALHRIHRSIGVALERHVRALPECIQGFRKDRSIATNAALHTGAAIVVTADIRGFFDRITIGHVRRVFLTLGAPLQTATVLARLCTRYDVLPQGGPASPAISNLAVPALDSALQAIGPNAAFSRYADDLTFSGEEADCPSAEEIDAVLNAHGFSLRPRSFRWQSRRSGQIVTGLSVISGAPHLTRRRRREIERDLYVGMKYGIDGETYKHMSGAIHAAGGVDRELWKRWCTELDKVTVKATEEDYPE